MFMFRARLLKQGVCVHSRICSDQKSKQVDQDERKGTKVVNV